MPAAANARRPRWSIPRPRLTLLARARPARAPRPWLSPAFSSLRVRSDEPSPTFRTAPR